MKLETTILSNGIKYRFLPFGIKKRFIDKNNIEKFELINDKYLKDYGGWSFRRSFGWRKGIFIIIGNSGIKITLKDGSKLILGTQKPGMFIKALERMDKHK